jgi:predicted amidophosphoribosyltransferase
MSILPEFRCKNCHTWFQIKPDYCPVCKFKFDDDNKKVIEWLNKELENVKKNKMNITKCPDSEEKTTIHQIVKSADKYNIFMKKINDFIKREKDE